MLVYLDTSHLAMLDRLRCDDPTHFACFIERWTTRECVLVLSLNHAQELAQLADETSRQRRLDVIGQFPRDRIRFSHRGSAGLLGVEIVAEIRALTGGGRMPLEEIQRVLFAQTFDDFTTIVAENVEAFHRGLAGRSTLVAGFNDLAEVWREMETLRVAHKFPKVDLTDPNLDWEQMVRLMESTLPKGVEDTPTGRALIGFIRLMNDLVKRHKNVRRAVEELYGLRGMEVTPTLRQTDLAAASMFFASAREKIKQIAEASDIALPFLMALLPKLNPYKVPGYSLGIAINRARQLSGNRAETGDQVDDDHITFAPYVDALFVDRRMFAFLNQELRDRPELLGLPPDGRVRFAGTICKLEQALGL